MIEIDALAAACGLSTFRYHAFPPLHFPDVPVAPPEPAAEAVQAEPEPASVPAMAAAPRLEPVLPKPEAAPPPRAEPLIVAQAAAPPVQAAPVPAAPVPPPAIPVSPQAFPQPLPAVLQDVAATVGTAPGVGRPARAQRTARSAWRSATSPQQPH